MIHVIATIEVQDGKRDELLAAFRELVPAVRQEDGCLDYGPAIDLTTTLEAQPPVRTNVVTVVERWESMDALEAHLIAPHMLAYRAKVKDIVKTIALHVLEPAY